VTSFPARLERLGEVDSTQRVVRAWLDAGQPEVAVAVADVQTAGRGRGGRTWSAPPGTALLASAGFRPGWLPVPLGWRLAAVVALAMADAAEEVAGLRDGTLWLKWPNDLVADGPDGSLRKVAGVLGETALAGDAIDGAVVGIGVNAGWRAADFPADLAGSMTSLLELSRGRPIDRDALLEAWLDRLEPRYEALRAGRFDAGGWSRRQRTTGHRVEVDAGAERIEGVAMGVDPDTGALLVARPDGSLRAIGSGEVIRCRVVDLPGRRGPSAGAPARNG
jgi:BirA family transcriptional regulator, biotin operon repressor / biotin---[acetyl-CoA-carboxylase] ligase